MEEYVRRAAENKNLQSHRIKSLWDNKLNKLTKSNTVSYRGAANEKLSAYGTVFKLEPTETEGIYYLVGDKEQESSSVPEELVDIEKELDIEPLDNLDIDVDDVNLEKFDFNFN